MPKSLIDYAYDFINKQTQPTKFEQIWAYVCENAGLSEEEAKQRISRFYTNLMLDGRFVTLGENEWDLRTRHTFDKVHIDMRDVYSDVEAIDDDSEEEEEEAEYNSAFEEPKTDLDDDAPLDDDQDTDEEEVL